MTLQERCEKRRLLHGGRYFLYQGQSFDLSIALPDYARLRKAFTIRFDSYGEEPPKIYCGKHMYDLVPPLLTYDNGYPCIQGKYRGSKGLHKIPLHRIAYVAYYGAQSVEQFLPAYCMFIILCVCSDSFHFGLLNI